MTREQKIIYLAGLFDGEGCVGLYNTRTKIDRRAAHYQLLVRVTQKVPYAVEMLLEVFGGRVYTLSDVGPSKPGPYFSWRAVGQKAENALRELLPYLMEKKSQAELAIEFQEFRREQNIASKTRTSGNQRLTTQELDLRDEYVNKMKALKQNKFGLDYFASTSGNQ